jgi:hypothetical protein
MLIGINGWAVYVILYVAQDQGPPYAKLALYVFLRSAGWMALTWILFWILDREPSGLQSGFRMLSAVPILSLGALADIVCNRFIRTWGIEPLVSTVQSQQLGLELHDTLLWIFMILAIGSGVHFRRREIWRQRRESDLQASLLRAKIDVLTGRLQPHFLFNALNGLSALISSDPVSADRMVRRLGHLLHAAIDSVGQEFITVREEIEFVRQYLEVQQLRFEDRLRFSITYPVEALDYKTLPFLLQPLVENAVRHGIEPIDNLGTVDIRISIMANRLVFTVRNTAPADVVVPPMREGVGLTNTRARLELVFPGKSELSFSREEDGSIRTIVAVPLMVAGA